MIIDYFYLAAAVGAYAAGLLCQSVGARRSAPSGAGVRGLTRLIGDPVYIVGFACQVTGFALAFLARAHLPLYLVQGAVCASVALASLLGFVLLRRRTSASELAVFGVMASAIVLLLVVSRPSNSYEIGGLALVGLVTVAFVVAGATWFASRSAGAVPLACLAGVSFAILAVAGRPVASHVGFGLLADPLAWLVVVTAVVGQLQMGLALARGSTTLVGSVMDAVTLLAASGVGFLLLGDRVGDGLAVWVIVGLAACVGGVIAMAAIEKSQVRAMSKDVAARAGRLQTYVPEG